MGILAMDNHSVEVDGRWGWFLTEHFTKIGRRVFGNVPKSKITDNKIK